MATTSPIQGVPLPQATDADNVPYDLAQIVGFLEKRVVMVFASAAARDASITAPTEGMMAYLQDTDETTQRIGSAWVRVLTRNDLAGSGAATSIARSDHTHTAYSSTSHTHAGAARVQKTTAGVNANVNGRTFIATGFTFDDLCVIRVSRSVSGTEENDGIQVTGTSGATGIIYLSGVANGTPGIHATVVD